LLITEQCPQLIPHLHIAIAFAKGGFGDFDSFFGNIWNEAGMQRHGLSPVGCDSKMGLLSPIFPQNPSYVDSPTASVTPGTLAENNSA
jgi:hypothetical protein